MDIIATNYKYYRKLRRYSQETVARMAGISTHTYGMIERNMQIPQFLTAYKICRALEISMDDVITDNQHDRSAVMIMKPKYGFYPNRKFNKYNNNVRIIRMNMKLTQREVADKAEMCLPCFGSIDRGYSLPELKNALKIARALKTTVDRLFTINDSLS